MSNIPPRLVGTLSGLTGISGSLSGLGGLSGSLSGAPPVVPVYNGPYEFTPSQEAQTIQINGKMAIEDIVVNPIPSNWGLIAWNGSWLGIS